MGLARASHFQSDWLRSKHRYKRVGARHTAPQEHKWPLDACCGYAKRQCLFSENEMVCTHTLYNMVWDGRFPIKVTELPEALKRKGRKS